VTLLVSHHFRRVLLEVAEEHIETPAGDAPAGEGADGRGAGLIPAR
jgi:hypothetical protein